MKFPVQVMAHTQYEGDKETHVSFDISVAGTTIEGVSKDDAKALLKMLQKLVQVEKKEVSYE